MGEAAGPAVRNKGDLRIAVRVWHGFDFDGGHDESKGVDAQGRLVDVPAHRHEVSLDYTRLELALEYTLARNWDLALHLPYDVKRQTAVVEPRQPASPDQLAAQQRNLNLHHRSETYRGLSDPLLMVVYRSTGLFPGNDLLRVGLGAALPTGRTEANPLVRAAAGREHLHIQFGNGTVDPLLELQARASFARRWGTGLLLATRWPAYASDKGFRGPRELTSTLDLRWRATPRLALQAEWTLLRESQAHWDGLPDPNSGLLVQSLSLGVHVRWPGGSLMSLSLRQPLSQRPLAGGNETFTQGPALLAQWTRSLGGS